MEFSQHLPVWGGDVMGSFNLPTPKSPPTIHPWMRAFPLGNDFSLLSSAWKVNDLWKSNLFQKMASIRRILIYIDLFPEDKKNTYVKMENTNKSSLLQVQFKINKKTTIRSIAFLVPQFQVSTFYTTISTEETLLTNRLISSTWTEFGKAFQFKIFNCIYRIPIYPTPKNPKCPLKRTPFLNRKLHLPSINMLGFHRVSSPLKWLRSSPWLLGGHRVSFT